MNDYKQTTCVNDKCPFKNNCFTYTYNVDSRDNLVNPPIPKEPAECEYSQYRSK